MKKYLFLLLLLSLAFTSCMSKKKIVYLQGNQNVSNSSANYEPIIQNDDRLSIQISTLEPEASVPFNLESSSTTSSINTINSGYLVDNKGTIDFPVLGTIQVAGYSIEQLKLLLKEKLSKYLVDPVINIRLLNFKVTVLGAVGGAGVKMFQNERVTLLDALAEAGDLTIFGKRHNILIVRDFQGLKTFNRVDITKADFVNSPFYYLDQNDVIYVEERKAKIDASALPNLPLVVSVISFLVTLTILISK